MDGEASAERNVRGNRYAMTVNAKLLAGTLLVSVSGGDVFSPADGAATVHFPYVTLPIPCEKTRTNCD
jgi:hypothetical protein